MGVIIMKLLLVSALCLMAASPAWSTCLGSVNIKDYGDVFIMAPDWAAGAISIQNNGFTMRGNSRLYFGNRCENGWAPDAYAQIPLNNKHFAYTLDLSNVPCHCNAAAYFVKMPGNNPGWARTARTPASTCAMTAATSPTWPPATTGWCSPPVCGEEEVSTWAGWTG